MEQRLAEHRLACAKDVREFQVTTLAILALHSGLAGLQAWGQLQDQGEGDLWGGGQAEEGVQGGHVLDVAGQEGPGTLQPPWHSSYLQLNTAPAISPVLGCTII